MATNLNKLFVFVANENVESFVNTHEGNSTDTYAKKIAFLSGTGEIMTHGERFAISSNTDLTNLKNLIGVTLDLSNNLTADTIIGAINEIFEIAKSNETSITTINTSIGDENSGIVQDINIIKTNIGDSNSGLIKRVDDLETTVGDTNSGLVQAINTLNANSTTTGSVDYKIAEAKKEILTGGSQETIDTAYDTLLEIAQWIQNDQTGAAYVADLAAANAQAIVDISAAVNDLSTNKTTVINEAINSLDSSVTLAGTTANNPATVTIDSSIEVLGGIKIVEEDGLLDSTNSTKIILKADAAGAAAKAYEILLGTDEDDIDDNTIKGLKAAINSIDVSAVGETGNTSLIIASADNNTVTVTSSNKLQTAVGLAETAIQEITVTSTDTDALTITGSPVNNTAHALSFTPNIGVISVDGSVNTLKYNTGDDNKLVSVSNIVNSINNIDLWEDIVS